METTQTIHESEAHPTLSHNQQREIGLELQALADRDVLDECRPSLLVLALSQLDAELELVGQIGRSEVVCVRIASSRPDTGNRNVAVATV